MMNNYAPLLEQAMKFEQEIHPTVDDRYKPLDYYLTYCISQAQRDLICLGAIVINYRLIN